MFNDTFCVRIAHETQLLNSLSKEQKRTPFGWLRNDNASFEDSPHLYIASPFCQRPLQELFSPSFRKRAYKVGNIITPCGIYHCFAIENYNLTELVLERKKKEKKVAKTHINDGKFKPHNSP